MTVAVAAVTGAVDRSRLWGWTSPRTLGLLAAGVVLLAAFMVIESRAEHPLVNLALFRNRLLGTAAIMVIGPAAASPLGHGSACRRRPLLGSRRRKAQGSPVRSVTLHTRHRGLRPGQVLRCSAGMPSPPGRRP
ncbi:hypothetical protein SSP24_80220 [Streptomyces spinoverrucosus]|uniref:Major facilitator superfamily (MFS) profile domain-containing protein n=1 Tax=Streptomyces spinoverrucosus TaxID=284043 RepID=A0A4Y3VU38_9ACTN|nr:hypothetical protein SSP24_80220 [Streptomyces spinoverrucosus]GHB98457.1 hypothetical protein GCM10010397_83620 [Streptomyces spinoverrucosus]